MDNVTGIAIGTASRPDIGVVRATAECLTATNAAAFRAALRTSVLAKRRIVLDLGGVACIDRLGLGALLAGLRTASAVGGEVKLACLSQDVRSLARLERVEESFEIFDTVAAAVAAFS
jgi:anti-sigma B factor antagonist